MTELILSRRDLAFLLHEWLDAESLCSRPRYAEHSRDTFDATLELCEQIASDFFYPINRLLDEQEPRFDGERVTTPAELKTALRVFADAGLTAAGQDEADGGMQLPCLIEKAAFAYVSGASVAASGYPMLTIGNANVIRRFGTPEQVERELELGLAVAPRSGVRGTGGHGDDVRVLRDEAGVHRLALVGVVGYGLGREDLTGEAPHPGAQRVHRVVQQVQGQAAGAHEPHQRVEVREHGRGRVRARDDRVGGPGVLQDPGARRQHAPADGPPPVRVGLDRLDPRDDDVDHAVHQLVATGDVLVQRHGRHVEGLREAAHRDGLQADEVGELDGRGQHLVAVQGSAMAAGGVGSG